MRRSVAMFTTACTMQDEPSGSAMSVTKQRSILILSNGKALQIAQRGVAGAEIVERDPDADGAKLMQNGKRRIVVADEDGFGDFKLQPARRQDPRPPAPR